MVTSPLTQAFQQVSHRHGKCHGDTQLPKYPKLIHCRLQPLLGYDFVSSGTACVWAWWAISMHVCSYCSGMLAPHPWKQFSLAGHVLHLLLIFLWCLCHWHCCWFGFPSGLCSSLCRISAVQDLWYLAHSLVLAFSLDGRIFSGVPFRSLVWVCTERNVQVDGFIYPCLWWWWHNCNKVKVNNQTLALCLAEFRLMAERLNVCSLWIEQYNYEAHWPILKNPVATVAALLARRFLLWVTCTYISYCCK